MEESGPSCPHEDCGEALTRNKKGEFPKFCPECDKPTGLSCKDNKHCPNPDCGELLKKNKKGVYPKHCVECGSLTDIEVKEESGRVCPNVDCGEKLVKNKQRLYPKFCPECSCHIDRRTDVSTHLSADLQGAGTSLKLQNSRDSSPSVRDSSQSAHGSNFDNEVERSQRLKTAIIAQDVKTTFPVLSQSELLCCPVEDCQAERKRSKTGALAPFCRKCKLDFHEYEAKMHDETSASIVTLPDRPNSLMKQNAGESGGQMSLDSQYFAQSLTHTAQAQVGSGPPVDGMTKSWVVIDDSEGGMSRMDESGDKSTKPSKRPAGDMSEGKPDNMPVYKTPRTPEREMASLSPGKAEKTGQSQNEQPTKTLVASQDDDDGNSSSDNEKYLTPPESEDEEMPSNTEDKVTNTDMTRSEKKDVIHLADPSLSPYIPVPDGSSIRHSEQADPPKYVTTLVLRPLNNKSETAQSGKKEQDRSQGVSDTPAAKYGDTPTAPPRAKTLAAQRTNRGSVPDQDSARDSRHTHSDEINNPMNDNNDISLPSMHYRKKECSPYPSLQDSVNAGNSGSDGAEADMANEETQESVSKDMNVKDNSSVQVGTSSSHEASSVPGDVHRTNEPVTGEENRGYMETCETGVDETDPEHKTSSDAEKSMGFTNQKHQHQNKQDSSAENTDATDQFPQAFGADSQPEGQTFGSDSTSTRPKFPGFQMHERQAPVDTTTKPIEESSQQSHDDKDNNIGENATNEPAADHKKDGNEIIANKDQSEDRSSSVTDDIKLENGDIVLVFVQYRNSMRDAKEARKLTKEQEVTLDKAIATANNRYSNFVGNQSSSKNVRTRQENRQYEEAIKSFRNFIKTNGAHLNKIFKSVGVPKVDVEFIPAEKESIKRNSNIKQNRGKFKVHFRVTLSQPLMKHFKQERAEPQVEIRSNIGGFNGQPLITMKKSEGEVWVGSWTPPPGGKRLMYKYFVSDGVDASDDNFEWLGQTTWAGPVNRYVDIPVVGLQEDRMVYDGVLLMKDNSKFFKKIWAQFKTSVFNYTSAKEEQLAFGVHTMFPSWVTELKKGNSVEVLCDWITNVRHQQRERISGYPKYISAAYPSYYSAEKLIDNVFMEYVLHNYAQHRELLERSEDIGLIISSLIGLLEISRCRYNEPCAAAQHLSVISETVALTMERAAMLLTDQPIDLEGVRSFLSPNSKFIEDLVAGVRYTLNELQRDVLHRRTWMWLIPLLQILNRYLKNSERGLNYDTTTWWGVQQLKSTIDSHRNTYPRVVDWKMYFQMFYPFFQGLPVMPFTFLAVLTAEQLDSLLESEDNEELLKLPTSGVIACVRYHVGEYNKFPNMTGKLLNYLQRKRTTEHFNTSTDDQCLLVTESFLVKALSASSTDVKDMSILAVSIYILLLDALLMKDKATEIQLHVEPLVNYLDRFKRVYDNKLNSPTGYDYNAHRHYGTGSGYTGNSRYDDLVTMSETELNQWAELFSCAAGNRKLADWWADICSKTLKRRLEKVAEKSEMAVVNLYCTHNFELPTMDQTFADAALLRAEKLLESGSTSLTKALPEKVGKLVDRALTKAWNSEDESAMSIVRNMLKWGNFLSVWKFYQHISEEQRRAVSEINAVRIGQSESALEAVVKGMVDGNISFADFTILSENEKDVFKLCEISENLKKSNTAIQAAFVARRAEMEKFMKFSKLLAGFWSDCKPAVAEKGQIDEWLRANQDTLIFSQCVSASGHIICEPVPMEIQNILGKYIQMKPRKIFSKVFQQFIKRGAADPGDIMEILTYIENSEKRYIDELERLNSGEISIEAMERIINTCFNGDRAEFIAELKDMLDKNVYTHRRRQIEICYNLDQYHRGAEVIMELKEMFQLSGDFNDLQKILKSADKQLQLKDISLELVDSAASIRDIRRDQIDCLRAFLDCEELIQWIRKEVPKKDISNFVDLASSTLGEDDQAALKTRYLLNALTGYSPLIYDLDAKGTDYNDFIEICRKVWEAKDKNPQLVTNLTSSNTELEWLKKVKSHFGNVEIRSIAQATSINEDGLYYVGNIEHYSKDFKSLEDVIQLRCRVKDKDKSEAKTYSYSQLKELQSKLTLVAGEQQKENKETIQRFDAMRDAVENLARKYIDIRREGCIQFDDMLVVVHCNSNHKTAMEVRLQSIGVSMLGLNNGQKDPIAHCQDLYRYMDNCIKNWRESMDTKRSAQPELNFYTTEQLVVLRKELGTFLDDHSPDVVSKALPLLAMIQAVKPEHLLQMINSYNPSTNNKGSKVEEEVDAENAFITYDKMSDAQRELVDEVLEEHEDFDDMLAVQCINELKEQATLEHMIEWIEQYKHKQRQMKAEQAKQAKVDNENALQTSDQLITKIMKAQSRGASLMDKLEKLWHEFIENTKQSIKNFLGIPHLGHVLEQIRKLKEAQEQQRRLPAWLRRGFPCLIPTPQAKVYQTVLTIYECDGGSSFPTRNEVLLCNEKTTVEEVRLFMSRALNDPFSFYCMVNCHLLGYKACSYIETRLTNTADDTVKTYGLAFIYAEEKRDARIRAYLDKHLAKNVELSSPDKLKRYVQDILTVPQEVRLTACSVDPTRSCSRLIRSARAGVGKSLTKFNLCNQVRRDKKLKGKDITIPIYKTIDTNSIIAKLNNELGNGYTEEACHTIHIDIAHEVEMGVDEMLFNLVVLRSLVNSEGAVWQSQQTQYYIIECMPYTKGKNCAHEVMDYLPTTLCITPQEAANTYTSKNIPKDFNGFDQAVLREDEWQIVIKYLHCKQRGDRLFKKADGYFEDPLTALNLLIGNCGLRDPTWSELRHYVYFLSNQLRKVEQSPFCGQAFADDLPGFRAFVIDFMFRMAKDFATRSLKIAEETPGLNLNEAEEQGRGDALEQLGMKVTWESGNHPYLFFNEDGETFSPLGFFVENRGGNALSLVDCQTKEILVPNCMPTPLKQTLDRYKLPMSEDFNTLTRPAQLTKLRDIMVKTVKYSREVVRPDGTRVRQEEPTFVVNDDPDPNYVLTMDNAKKILAIHQRLRVEIPVIIMGETGCGKTKLIDFMSKLQIPTALKDEINTMIIVKIHGGTSEEDIIRKVFEAQDLALQNQQRCREYAAEYESSQVPSIYTILFLDEANTTEAIGLVKEILCDGRIRGEPLRANTGLKIIAACNPYRRHSDEMIEKLKKAGLGYNVGEEDTKDKFGQIPMRHLVYRVQALSQSLLPLVWDFGTLKSRTDDGVDVECAYIRQMIKKFNQTSGEGGLNFGQHTNLVADILTNTQSFMRDQKDECSFVSLRDIQRLLDVANWFYKQRRNLFPAIDGMDEDIIADDDEDNEQVHGQKDYSTRSLILAIGVCYLARLEDMTRENYAGHISAHIEELIGGEGIKGSDYLFDQIEQCQDMFIHEVIDKEQHVNIATNKALKENVFMMIICIENRIPLFVVGKPGSSKSLSKSMVIDAMKGNSSKKELFKRMKQTYMVSFQCSRHATPAGIVGVFNHCANFQKGQKLDMFVSVVVLDEVGLAEDSENMPLKTLHPLLEDGCEGNRKPEDWMKCAFVGISNWALDPAKMNRGIFVQRGTPDPNELTEIAAEICRSSQNGEDGVTPFIDNLAQGYLDICRAKKPEERDLTEFFGLRDFYSLMKMVVNFASRTGELNRNQLEHSIRRNFGGFDPESGFDPMDIFSDHCPTLGTLAMQEDGRPPIDSIGLIESSLSGEDNLVRIYCDVCGEKLSKLFSLPCKAHYVGVCCQERIQAALDRGEQYQCTVDGCNTPLPLGFQWKSENRIESRYLLILTENLSVLSIILDKFKSHDRQPEVVFGSKFPEDVSYTQVCHNIYRIKTCMDVGKPVILLNLDDLYESLYDALNQYFSTWGDRKFVDLGLGTHRVKTFVNENFRLVVIADKNKVHSEFPIPLINRLEKHYVSATSLLSKDQKVIKRELEEWIKKFVKPQRNMQQKMCPADCDMCGERLEKPYPLPCWRHYVGPCCKERLQEALDKRTEEDDQVKCDVEEGGTECDTEIPVDYEWKVDSVALENRQYFENSTRETSFIGYSSETTALAVMQATSVVCAEQAESQETEDQELQLQKVYERSKYYMLLCATAESVMRLERTDLKHEAKAIQEIYLRDQHHETLLQYLENEFNYCAEESLFLQVTSFAELMSKRDVDILKDNLNSNGSQQVDVYNIYLKDFLKEDQFTDSIRAFYVGQSDHKMKLLLVQCESADENTELLDSVRFIVQRESEVADDCTHTVLLLNLPRGRNFSGYQGGKWKCVHIDDPRSPEIKLPSLSKCMKLKPSQIIAKLLPKADPKEEARAAGVEAEAAYTENAAADEVMDDTAVVSDINIEMAETGDNERASQDDTEEMNEEVDDSMPPLEGDDQPVTIKDNEYPDVELLPNLPAEREAAHPIPRPQTTKQNRLVTQRQQRENEEDLMFGDLLLFILQCLPQALSVIMADNQYDRDTLLKKILQRNQEFREIFLKHVHDLLQKQEENMRTHWVQADAAKASNMKQSETMRHALEDSLERAFVPALAAVISFIDVRNNLAMMDTRGPLSNIWLQIFNQCDKLGLQVDPQTLKLPKSFRIHQAGEGSQDFATQFPFSWLAKSTIDNLVKAASGLDFDELAETVSGQFKSQSPIGRVVYNPQYKRLHNQLLEDYLRDYVYLAHPCSSQHEHYIVCMSIMTYLEQRQIQNKDIIHIHLAYDGLKSTFSNLSAILHLTWKDEDGNDLAGSVRKELDQNIACDLVALRCLLVYLSNIKINALLTDPEKWVDRVDKSKYIISKVLDQRDEGGIILQCRETWWKLVLKKLFVEHVIIPTEPVIGKEGLKKRKPHKLSFFIKTVTGNCFQDFETFEQVVHWLQTTVIEGVQALYLKCPKNCPVCTHPLHSPVRLPCGHMICDTCVTEVKLCPEGQCDGRIPEGFIYDPAKDNIDDSKLEELKWLRKRLNKFFMAFVSEVVFGSDVEPDEDIIQWLLQCVTFGAGTRAFSLYNTADVVDPTPVLRSFLLKLLMQCTQSEHVQEHLNHLLADWGDDVKQKIQTMVLLMDCRKDIFMPNVSIEDVNQTNDEDVVLMTDRIDVPNVDLLSSVAEIQCILSYGVKELNLTTPQQGTVELQATEAALRKFIQDSARNGNCQPGYYTARQLYATEGESFIKDLLNTPHNYLIPDDVKRDLESFTVPDVLSVYGGQEYRAAKTAIDDVTTASGNQDAFTNAVNQLKMACQSDWLLLSVVFTRITRTFAQKTPVPQNITNGLWEQLNTQLQGKHQAVFGMVIRDGGLPVEMDVNTAQGINLSMLVLNLLSCMCNNQQTSDLNPLAELINQPLEAANHFLPTMVDNQVELYAAAFKATMIGTNVTIFHCPNGHPYFVDNCGQPMETKNCIECGAQIGGANHRALPNNRVVDINDRQFKSEPGHILGDAHRRQGPIAERDLSTLSCAVLRCLTHLCMFAGALFQPQQVLRVIQRNAPGQNQLLGYLDAHIRLDIQHISQSCGSNRDDCILMLHEVISRMKAAQGIVGNTTLASIQQRKAWEAQFDNNYIKPTFNNNREQILQQIKQQLRTADTVDIRRILSTADKPINEAHILATPGLWDYKLTLNVPRVLNILASLPKENFPLLRHIVSNCEVISAVQYLPDILELMRIFSDKFHSRYKRDGASRLQIGQFIFRYHAEIPNLRHLVDSFITAWNTMVTITGEAEQDNQEFSETTTLIHFLLDQHSKNKLSPAVTLIKFLHETQNRLVSTASQSLSTVPLRSVNSSNVVTMTGTQELIGVILSHSEYEMRDTTVVKYNWQAVEKEMIMKYQSNKPTIDFKVEELQYYIFQEDFNLHNQLKSINDSQEWLTQGQQVSVSSKLLPRVPTLTAHLKDLKVAINFLYGTKIEGDKSLAEYMQSFAKDLTYLPDSIKLRHVRDVWLLLKYTQTDLLMIQKQEPFDDIDTECREALTPQLEEFLRDRCMYNSPRTKLLLQELFKYIILRLNKAAVTESELDANHSLDAELKAFIQASANTDADDERCYQIIDEIPELVMEPENGTDKPPELLVKHAPRAWRYIWKRYTTRVE